MLFINAIHYIKNGNTKDACPLFLIIQAKKHSFIVKQEI